MTRSMRKQPNKEGLERMQVRNQPGPYMRSPALESAEQRRGAASQPIKSSGKSRKKDKVGPHTYYAASERAVGSGISAMPRKRLPRLGVKNAALSPGRVDSVGFTAGWRSKHGKTPRVSPEGRQNTAAVQEKKQKDASGQAVKEDEP